METSMKNEVHDVSELYECLCAEHGDAADPDQWWPNFYGGRLERAITNILVTQSKWERVKPDLDQLHNSGLLHTDRLAAADTVTIANCIKTSGLSGSKAGSLQSLARFVVEFGGDQTFREQVTRVELLSIRGVGEESADRILLYTCHRLAWPVDTYCLRVFAHYRLAPFPENQRERRGTGVSIRAMVADQLPAEVPIWQRMHALMQLEGSALRK